MRISRRALLFLGGASIALVAVPPAIMSLRRNVLNILAQEFSPVVAGHPEAEAFARSYSDRFQESRDAPRKLSDSYDGIIGQFGGTTSRQKTLRRRVITAFVRETNAVIAEETGESLVFLGGPFDPYERPCSNPLSAQWL